ncbi:Na+/H+ antiporter subunit A [Pseudoclavibacter sp. CFCC 11306]|uniref:Na+/H+ antiporter subunit A n=1 Tax=Pseudoclavibacter sp. CFCC 11306 TaxID=1564493 RepID=UPI001CE43420|nr:Na+/H+ antiporter subunit A [Pseudoclavibacter sp. CFCC 11306]
MPVAFVAVLVAMLIAWPSVRRWGSRGFMPIGTVVAVAFLALLAEAPKVLSGAVPAFDLPWIPQLGVSLSFQLDALSWAMSLVVTGVGALVLFYCSAYFTDSEPSLSRFATLLTSFAAVMLGLVTSDDIVVMFVFWEVTSVLSYLLIGHTSDRRESRGAALQALLVTTFGGLIMLVGVAILVVDNGTTSLTQIVADPAMSAGTPWAVLMIVIGALSKSAIVPFHFWLPSAMAGPTPVSAYLHSAAMVKAGIYLVLRFAPGYAQVPGWHEVLVPLGLVTLLIGGWRALRQYDLKLLLAYGTVSQLGLLITVAAIGTHDAAVAALALLVAHSLFKASLFMIVGVIDHNFGTRDLRALRGLGRGHPLLAVVTALSAASMAGLPPMLGFLAKESALTAMLDWQHGWSVWVTAVAALGSVLTVAYSARFAFGALSSRPRKTGSSNVDTSTVHVLVDCSQPQAHGNVGLIGPVILLGLSLLLAIWPTGLDHLATATAAALPAGEHPLHLALWHGFTPALGISVIVIALGALLFVLRRPVAKLQARVPDWIELSRWYSATLAATDWISARVTLFAQRGGLPGYLGTVFVAFVAALGLALLRVQLWPGEMVPFHSVAQLGIAALMAVAALAAVRARRRLLAMLLVGATGYGMVALFTLQGAPDLALTQLLVETVTLVIFVLVARRLPRHFERAEGIKRVWPKAVIAVAVGAVMAGVALAVVGARSQTPISAQMPDLAYLEGHGRNVVNVLLVDLRGWDTMGEISVLVAVATGVASLVFVTHRTGRVPSISAQGQRRRRLQRLAPVVEPVTGALPVVDPSTGRPVSQTALQRTIDAHDEVDDDSTRRSWLMAGRTLAPDHRSLMVEVVVRLLFLPLMLISVMLLIAGHNQPGGGFAGGLVAGLALVLRYLAAGRYELGEALPVPPGVLLGTGLATAVGTGALSMLFGEPFLTSLWWQATLPIFGEVKLGTPTLFDIGVYLVVLGLVFDVLRSLGAGIDEQSVSDESIVDDWAEGVR